MVGKAPKIAPTTDNQIEHFAAYRDFVKKLRDTKKGRTGTSQCPVCKTPIVWLVKENGDVHVECGTSRGTSFNPEKL